jgi:hypothetical protein
MEIRGLWDGTPARPDEHVTVDAATRGEIFEVTVKAPFHDDPPPPAPAGSTPGLWEYEVVELFVAGEGDGYVEIELGPHGHFLVLSLRGYRDVIRTERSIDYSARINAARWQGQARIPAALLPASPQRMNAFAIHGRGALRRYLALYPTPGASPDFHRLDCFGPWPAGSDQGWSF